MAWQGSQYLSDPYLAFEHSVFCRSFGLDPVYVVSH